MARIWMWCPACWAHGSGTRPTDPRWSCSTWARTTSTRSTGRRRRSTLKPSGHGLRVLQSRFLRPAPYRYFLSHSRTCPYQNALFCGSRIQWPSSGMTMKREGTPCRCSREIADSRGMWRARQDSCRLAVSSANRGAPVDRPAGLEPATSRFVAGAPGRIRLHSIHDLACATRTIPPERDRTDPQLRP